MTRFARLYLWATERLYHELAWAYDLASWLVSLGRWHSWRRLALAHVAGERVLEVGFGTGELLIEMAGRGLTVIGLDPSPAMHRVTGRKLARCGLEAARVRGLVQAAPFVDGQFDSVVCTFPAGYILDPETLRQVARLLRAPAGDGETGAGRLIVVGLVVSHDSWLWRNAMRLLFGAGGEPGLDGFTQLARAEGLRASVVSHRDKGWWVPVIVAERCSA